MPTTPVTKGGLEVYDHLPAFVAAVTAWDTPGRRPRHHRRAQGLVTHHAPHVVVYLVAGTHDPDPRMEAKVVQRWCELDPTVRRKVARAMPLVARALDRLAG